MATDIWEKYEKSKNYMDGKCILENTERNWKMYLGQQWEAVKDSEGLEDLPMLNFIQQVVKYKVSTIAQHSVTAIFSDMNNQYSEAASNLSKLFDISWERAKMDMVTWKALKNSAVAGDGWVYWYDGDTRKTPQIIHNTNIHLGDENNPIFNEQPFIIIDERLPVDVVKKRAKDAGCKDCDMIVPDSDTYEQLFNKKEVSDKVTSLLYMEIKDGILNIARATKMVVYEELHPVMQVKNGAYSGNGLTRYPIIPIIWEEMPNCARGCSEVAGLIPNQLELNKTLARRVISVKTTAFPRIAVDDSALQNPEDLDKVGAVIKLNGGNAQSVSSMISYLAPQSMSSDAKVLTDELLQTTKDLAGASDTALGNVDLSRVSGSAASTIRDQQQVPLNEQVKTYQNFIEDVALLYFDIWRAYYPNGIEMDGISVSAEELNGIVPNVRIDIAENSTLSTMASQQELTNLFNNNKITFEEFAEAYPEHSSIGKDVLMKIVNNRRAKQEAMQQQFAGEEVINNDVEDSMVSTGGASGGSSQYQAIQSQLNGGLVQ